ncbi:putative reverse transcriptase/RNA-dependent DNA polymerase, partial [Fagus crenata]
LQQLARENITGSLGKSRRKYICKIKEGIRMQFSPGGKENLRCEVDLKGMYDGKCPSDSRGVWKRVLREKDSNIAPGGYPLLSGIKRVGSWPGDELPASGSQKKAKGKNCSVIQDFGDVVNRCRLTDLEFRAVPFTWENRRNGAALVQKRLDKALTNGPWLDLFNLCTVTHLVCSYSDHVPLLIGLDASLSHCRPKRCPRKFEEKWALHPKKLKEHTDTLTALIQENDGGHLNDSIASTKAEINKLLMGEELHWRQRLRMVWLAIGDKNTKFFHAQAHQRRQTNSIKGLLNENNAWCTDENEVKAIAINYFAGLFRTNHPGDLREVISAVNSIVTPEVN